MRRGIFGLLVLVLVPCAYGQGQSKASAWRQFDRVQKLIFISGVAEGARTATELSAQIIRGAKPNPASADTALVRGFVSDLTALVDFQPDGAAVVLDLMEQYYNDASNGCIRATQIFLAARRRLRGDSAGAVEEYLRIERGKASVCN